MKSGFMAGAARVAFTPDESWYPLYRDLGDSPDTLPEYQKITNKLTVSLDEMYARAIAVRSGETTVLLITVDYIGVRNGVEKVKELSAELGLPEQNIYLIATHTHNMPMTDIKPGFMAPEEKVRELVARDPDVVERHRRFGERMSRSINQAAREAVANLRPARVGIGYSQSYVNVNRDQVFSGVYMMGTNVAGVSDKTAALIRFEDENGATIARIANYACHAVVMYMNRCGKDGTGGASADLPGFVSRAYEERDPGSVCLWMPGACGNQNPLYMNFLSYPDPETGEVREELLDPGNYQILKFLGFRQYNDLRCAESGIAEYSSEISLRTVRAYNDIPVREDRPVPFWRGGKPGCITLITSGIQLGDILLYGIGGELYCDVGARLKEISPVKNTLICTLCVGSVPYMMGDKDLMAPTLFARRTPWKPGTLLPVMEGFLDNFR